MTPDVHEKYEQTLPSATYPPRGDVPMADGVKLYTVTVMKKAPRTADIAVAQSLHATTPLTGRDQRTSTSSK